MSSPIQSKRELNSNEANLGFNPRRSKRLKARDSVTVRLMQSDEIKDVLNKNLEGLLEFCSNDGQRKATNEYHYSHEERNIKKMKSDCDEGYKQFNRRVWVAVNKTGVIGTMEIKPRPRKKIKDRAGVQLDNVCVVKEHRGTGVAQTMLKEVESYCKRQKIRSIHLTTQDNLTRAIKFYEKEGYQFTHQKKWDSYLLYYYKKDM